MAAGIVLVREAGGIATGPTGRSDMFETGTVVAGVPAIQKALIQRLNDQ